MARFHVRNIAMPGGIVRNATNMTATRNLSPVFVAFPKNWGAAMYMMIMLTMNAATLNVGKTGDRAL